MVFASKLFHTRNSQCMDSCLIYEVTYKPSTMVLLQNSKKPHVYNHLLSMRTSEADILEYNKLHLTLSLLMCKIFYWGFCSLNRAFH